MDGENFKFYLLLLTEYFFNFQDEYKESVYERSPDLRDVDTGDMSRVFAIKSKLNCKPFKYFLDVVAPGESNRRGISLSLSNLYNFRLG